MLRVAVGADAFELLGDGGEVGSVRRCGRVWRRAGSQYEVLAARVARMLAKSREQLLEDEVRCYAGPSGVDPTLLGFSMLGLP